MLVAGRLPGDRIVHPLQVASLLQREVGEILAQWLILSCTRIRYHAGSFKPVISLHFIFTKLWILKLEEQLLGFGSLNHSVGWHFGFLILLL